MHALTPAVDSLQAAAPLDPSITPAEAISEHLTTLILSLSDLQKLFVTPSTSAKVASMWESLIEAATQARFLYVNIATELHLNAYLCS